MAENIQRLPIFHTISLAWEKTKGVKKSIWAAVGVVFLILILISICFALFPIVFVENISKLEHPLKIILGAISNLITFLFQMGLLFLGMKRAANLSVSYRTAFSTFKFVPAMKLIGYYLLQFIIIALIFLPFTLITILLNKFTSDISKDFFSGLILIASTLVALYVFLRMYLTPGFIVDKKVNPWQAIKLSFLSTRSNFVRLLIINIIEMLIVLISLIPLGIGLIWTLPFTIICYGVIYQYLVVNAYPNENNLISE